MVAHELPVTRMAIMAADGVEGVECDQGPGSGPLGAWQPIVGPVPLSRLVPRAMHGVIWCARGAVAGAFGE